MDTNTTQNINDVRVQEDITKIEDIPVIDLEKYMNHQSGTDDAEVKQLCNTVADCLHKYGILIVRDPRVIDKDNDDYIDLMEKYFDSRGNLLYSGNLLDDAKPDCHYQVGVCPEFQERAREHTKRMKRYTQENKPVSPIEPIFDAKWRFMWKIGERPENAGDNFPQVVPKDFDDWEQKMDNWGNKLIDAVYQVAEMSAIGMGLEKDEFTKKMQGGAHLLAPTGSDLIKNEVGSIFAGFHYDIAFLTIHGKSRFPGLYVWLRNNQKLQVKVPKGCLLLQAGKTFEHITGGYILAGFHEVVYTQQTKEVCEQAIAQGKSTWRVSSTLFSHFRNDTDCSPLPELAKLYKINAAEKFPKMTAFEILMTELGATNMILESSEFSNVSNPEDKKKDGQQIPAQQMMEMDTGFQI